MHIPHLTETYPCFNELVERSALLTCTNQVFNDLADKVRIPHLGVQDQEQRWQIQGEIDAIVAHIYQLTKSEFEHILSTFTTGKNQERLQALKDYAMDAFEGRAIDCYKKAS